MNKETKTVFGALAALALLIGVGGTLAVWYYAKYYDHKQWLARQVPEKVVNELMINPDDSFRTVCYKNEEEGLKDLLRLARTVDLEEAFVYSPCEEKWIETGYGATERETLPVLTEDGRGVYMQSGMSIRATGQTMETVLCDCGKGNSYHVQSLKDVINAWSVPDDGLIQYALPSPRDFVNMIIQSVDIYNKFPNAKVKFGIASPMGVTYYWLTKEGVEKYKEYDFSNTEELESLLRDRERKLEEKFADLIRERTEKAYREGLHVEYDINKILTEGINMICQFMSSPYIQVIFTSVEEITRVPLFSNPRPPYKLSEIN